MSLNKSDFKWKGFEIIKSKYLKESITLLDYQQYTIYLALNTKSYLMGLPTGSGKTVTSLSTFFYFKEKFPKTKLIIFTDTSAILQFNSEISKFFNYDKERLVVYDTGGNYRKRRHETYKRFANDENVEVLILNYQSSYLDFPEIFNMITSYKGISKENKVYCIYDEATAFKNVSTQTHKSIHKISSLVDKRIALTATLTKGKAEEIYGVFKGIGIYIEKNKEAFLSRYCILKKIPKFNFSQVVGYKNVEELKLKIQQHSISINKADIYDSLPSFCTKVINVEIDTHQKQLIKDIKNGKFIKEDLENHNSLSSKIMEYGYIRRSLIDPNIVLSENEKLNSYKSPKTLQILKMLEEDYTDEKLIIYCASKKYINILEDEIKNCNNKRYKKVLKITGDINSEQREKYKELFTTSVNHNIILINNAGIQSINLQISGTIICCNFPDNGGNLLQLMGRISRIGSQHSKLNIVYLINKKSPEEDEYFILNKQLLLLKSILGESEKGIIDMEVIKMDSQFKDISDEDFLNLSLDKIMYKKYGGNL